MDAYDNEETELGEFVFDMACQMLQPFFFIKTFSFFFKIFTCVINFEFNCFYVFVIYFSNEYFPFFWWMFTYVVENSFIISIRTEPLCMFRVPTLAHRHSPSKFDEKKKLPYILYKREGMQVHPCFLLSSAGSVRLSGFRRFDRRLGFTASRNFEENGLV